MHHDYDNTASGFQLSLPDGAIPVNTHPYNETIRVQQHNNTFQKNQAVDQCRDSSIVWDLPFSLYLNTNELKHYTFLCKYTKEQLTLSHYNSTRFLFK